MQAYGRELAEARECCKKYRTTGKDAELTQVLFHLTYKRVNDEVASQLPWFYWFFYDIFNTLQAWDLYYHVFRRIDKQLPSLTKLDLQVSNFFHFFFLLVSG